MVLLTDVLYNYSCNLSSKGDLENAENVVYVQAWVVRQASEIDRHYEWNHRHALQVLNGKTKALPPADGSIVISPDFHRQGLAWVKSHKRELH